MEDDDAIMLKTKKKKLAIDPDEEAEGRPNFITTKSQEEKPDRENFEHKANGDKSKEAKKQTEKKDDAKPKTDNRSVSPSKPKPAGDKDKQPAKREEKVVVKPKPIPSSGSEKKSSEANGQVQKKAPEEKKTPSNPPKKRKVESSSESESESEDEKPRKKQVSSSKPKPKPAKKESSAGPEAKTVVKTKDVLVYDVLKRWWYCMPDWPPAGFDYNAELAKQKLRKVDQKYWRIEPETDANGFKKVFEMPSYPGMFKNSKGEIIDLRPKDSCPSYEVFKKKSILELCELKAKALKGQIDDLEKSVVVDEDLLKQLKKELIQAEKSYERQKEKK